MSNEIKSSEEVEGGTTDWLISEELFNLFHQEGFMIGYGHGPSKEYRVEIKFHDLLKYQRFYSLLYDLFNPTPLECPVCGAQKAFAIYPYDHSTGYCSAEQKSWTIRSGSYFVRREEAIKGLYDALKYSADHARPSVVQDVARAAIALWDEGQ